MRKLAFLIIIVIIGVFFVACGKSAPKRQIGHNEILFIGVAHFGQLKEMLSYDVNSAREQQALESICEAVGEFKPDKIYVEVQREYQKGLDGQYDLYLNGTLDPMDMEFDQLAFRCASTVGLSTVHALDIRPRVFDQQAISEQLSQAEKIKKAEQDSLDENNMIETFDKILNSGTMTDLIYHVNSPSFVRQDVSNVLSILDYGKPTDTTGLRTVSEWYARHIDMWSFIQRSVESKSGNRIVVIMGASHTSLLRQFVEFTPNWDIVELHELM